MTKKSQKHYKPETMRKSRPLYCLVEPSVDILVRKAAKKVGGIGEYLRRLIMADLRRETEKDL